MGPWWQLSLNKKKTKIMNRMKMQNRSTWKEMHMLMYWSASYLCWVQVISRTIHPTESQRVKRARKNARVLPPVTRTGGPKCQTRATRLTMPAPIVYAFLINPEMTVSTSGTLMLVEPTWLGSFSHSDMFFWDILVKIIKPMTEAQVRYVK